MGRKGPSPPCSRVWVGLPLPGAEGAGTRVLAICTTSCRGSPPSSLPTHADQQDQAIRWGFRRPEPTNPWLLLSPPRAQARAWEMAGSCIASLASWQPAQGLPPAARRPRQRAASTSGPLMACLRGLGRSPGPLRFAFRLLPCTFVWGSAQCSGQESGARSHTWPPCASVSPSANWGREHLLRRVQGCQGMASTCKKKKKPVTLPGTWKGQLEQQLLLLLLMSAFVVVGGSLCEVIRGGHM